MKNNKLAVNQKTILSVFDNLCKPSVAQSLSSIESALKNGSLVNVEIVNDSDTTFHFKFVFNNDETLETETFTTKPTKLYKHTLTLIKQDTISVYIIILSESDELINDIDTLILNKNKIIDTYSFNIYNNFSVNDFDYYAPNNQIVFSGFKLYYNEGIDKYSFKNASQFFSTDDITINDSITPLINEE